MPSGTAQVVSSCPCCGAKYSLQKFRDLHGVGVSHFPGHVGCFELRDCLCRDTLCFQIECDGTELGGVPMAPPVLAQYRGRQWWPVTKVAEILGVSPATVRRYIRKGDLESCNVPSRRGLHVCVEATLARVRRRSGFREL